MTPWWILYRLLISVAILYYILFTVLWIRNFCDGIRRPTAEVPKFVEALRSMLQKKERQKLESMSASFLTSSLDDDCATSHKALHVLLAGKCMSIKLGAFASFGLCVTLSLALDIQIQIAMTAPMLALAVFRVKFCEISLAKNVLPQYQCCGRAAVLFKFLWEDFTKWTGMPSFKFILGALNCTSAVSHGTVMAKALVDRTYQHRFMVQIGLGYEMHLCWLMILAECLSLVWVCGLVFEPTPKPFHQAMLMRILGFDRLFQHLCDEASTHYVPTAGEIFWFTLDLTIVKTLGEVIPCLLLQQQYCRAAGKRDIVTKLSIVLSLLLLIKQAFQLMYALYGHARSDLVHAQLERKEIRKYNVLFTAMASMTVFLMMSLSVVIFMGL